VAVTSTLACNGRRPGLTVSARTDIVRRAHDALNHGDTEAPAILCAADFRLDMSDRVFDPAVYSAHAGIRRFLAEVREVWETFTWEPTDVKEAGDVVLAFVHSLGRGARAGWRSIARAPCCDRSQTKRCSR
jgi:ketosteroid isomerase-like protein